MEYKSVPIKRAPVNRALTPRLVAGLQPKRQPQPVTSTCLPAPAISTQPINIQTVKLVQPVNTASPSSIQLVQPSEMIQTPVPQLTQEIDLKATLSFRSLAIDIALENPQLTDAAPVFIALDLVAITIAPELLKNSVEAPKAVSLPQAELPEAALSLTTTTALPTLQLSGLDSAMATSIGSRLASFPQAHEFYVNYVLTTPGIGIELLANPQNLEPFIEGIMYLSNLPDYDMSKPMSIPLPVSSPLNQPQMNPMMQIIQIGSFIIQARTAVQNNDSTSCMLLLITPQTLPLKMRQEIIAAELCQAPAGPEMALEVRCLLLECTQDISMPGSVTQEIIEIVNNLVVNVIVKIIKTKDMETFIRIARIIINYVSELDINSVRLVLTNHVKALNTKQQKRLEKIKRQMKKLCQKLALHPLILSISRQSSAIGKYAAQRLIESIMVQFIISQAQGLTASQIRELVLTARVLLADYLFKELGISDKDILLDKNNETKVLSSSLTGRRNPAHGITEADLPTSALKSALLEQLNKFPYAERIPTLRLATVNGKEVSSNTVSATYKAELNQAKEHAPASPVEQAAETILSSSIRQQVEDEAKTKAIVSALKNNDYIWNKLIDLVIFGQISKVEHFTHDLIAEARKLNHQNPYSQETLKIAAANVGLAYEALIAEAV